MTDKEEARLKEEQARFETTFSEMVAEASAYCTAREGVLASRQAMAAVYVAARRIAQLERWLESAEAHNADLERRVIALEAGRE